MLKGIQRKRGDRIVFNDLEEILEKLKKVHYLENFKANKNASNLEIEVYY